MKKGIIRKHLGILLVGFIHALKGTMASALVAASVVAFRGVLTTSSYYAVVMFMFGIIDTVLALVMFYWCGRDLLKGTFSK